MRNGLDLGGRTDGLVGSQTTLGIDQVRSEDGVDQSRLSETGLACIQQGTHTGQSPSKRGGGGISCLRTNTHHVELKPTLQQLPLNLRSDTVETDMTARENSRRRRARRGSRGHGEGKVVSRTGGGDNEAGSKKDTKGLSGRPEA